MLIVFENLKTQIKPAYIGNKNPPFAGLSSSKEGAQAPALGRKEAIQADKLIRRKLFRAGGGAFVYPI